MEFTLRKATLEDRPAIPHLMELSARGLGREDYTEAKKRARKYMGLNRLLFCSRRKGCERAESAGATFLLQLTFGQDFLIKEIEERRQTMNRIGMKILAIAMVLMLGVSSVMAKTRVRFKPGRNSTTVTGRLATNGMQTYVLRAGKGQVLTATLSSGNGKVDFTQANVHDTQYSFTVENTGDVEVLIDNHGGPTNYTLTISVQ